MRHEAWAMSIHCCTTIDFVQTIWCNVFITFRSTPEPHRKKKRIFFPIHHMKLSFPFIWQKIEKNTDFNTFSWSSFFFVCFLSLRQLKSLRVMLSRNMRLNGFQWLNDDDVGGVSSIQHETWIKCAVLLWTRCGSHMHHVGWNLNFPFCAWSMFENRYEKGWRMVAPSFRSNKGNAYIIFVAVQKMCSFLSILHHWIH